ncbi:MAG: hypothetical protein WA322_11435 [Pseudolabrys sp.]
MSTAMSSVLRTWAEIQSSAEIKRVVSRFVARRARGTFQRLVGDFVREHPFFGFVESKGRIAHGSALFVGQRLIKGPSIFIIVKIENAA